MTTEFGRDTSCMTELRSGRFVTGPRLVGEAAYRRLTTPRGMLRGGDEEANYGIDLLDMIGSVATKADASALGGRISAELGKDERIELVDTTVVATTDGPSTAFDITVQATTAEGPFTLQVRVSEVTIELLGLSTEES